MSGADEPVYPVEYRHPHDGGLEAKFAGLTKREYFAAMAMQGLIAKLPLQAVHTADSYDGQYPTAVARGALDYADALLAELARPVQP
jgi:hypothetical protein